MKNFTLTVLAFEERVYASAYMPSVDTLVQWAIAVRAAAQHLSAEAHELYTLAERANDATILRNVNKAFEMVELLERHANEKIDMLDGIEDNDERLNTVRHYLANMNYEIRVLHRHLTAAERAAKSFRCDLRRN